MRCRKHFDREYYFDRNLDIYTLFKCGEKTIEELARDYSLSPITIRKIVNAKGVIQQNTTSYYIPDIEYETYCTVLPKRQMPRIGG